MKWKGHHPSIEMTSTSADSGNGGKPSSFLSTQFLICKMGRVETMAVQYPFMSRADVQAELVGCALAPPSKAVLWTRENGVSRMVSAKVKSREYMGVIQTHPFLTLLLLGAQIRRLLPTAKQHQKRGVII